MRIHPVLAHRAGTKPREAAGGWVVNSGRRGTKLDEKDDTKDRHYVQRVTTHEGSRTPPHERHILRDSSAPTRFLPFSILVRMPRTPASLETWTRPEAPWTTEPNWGIVRSTGFSLSGHLRFRSPPQHQPLTCALLLHPRQEVTPWRSPFKIFIGVPLI